MCEQVYGLLLRDIGGGPPHDPLGKTHFLARKTLTFGVTVPQINSPRLVPRPHYSARPIRFEDTKAKCIDRESLGTRRRGTKQGRSLYQPTSRRKQPILLDRGHHWFPPKYQWQRREMSGCLFFFRVVLQHLEIWLPTRKLSPKNEAFPHLTELRFTVNQVFFLSV